MASPGKNVIVGAEPDVKTYSVTLVWANGEATVHQFGDMVGKGVFTALADPGIFSQLKIGERGRSLEWPDEIDFCADALWFEAHPQEAPRAYLKAADTTA